MTRTVDLVVVGQSRGARAAALDALTCGRRVLVVLASADARAARRARRRLRLTAHAAGRQLSVVTGARVVCVDGVEGVEAVVIRYTRTGRLCGVNASACYVAGRDGRRGNPSE